MAPLLALVVASVLFAATNATAQRIEVALPLDLAPPGARSAGMGRAFIGLADDATAAASNPAGLTNLSRPEISYHFRLDQLDAVRPAFGDAGRLRSRTSSVISVFFSYVMPIRNGRVAWSAFYHQNVKSSFRFREDFAEGIGNSFVYGEQDDSELAIGQVGGFFAVANSGRSVSLGVSVARSFASLNSRSRSFTLVENRLAARGESR